MRCIILAVALLACDMTSPNSDPEVTQEIPDQVVPFEGKAIHLDAHFTDADGDALTYSAVSDDPSLIAAEVRAGSLVLRQLVVRPGASAAITVTFTAI